MRHNLYAALFLLGFILSILPFIPYTSGAEYKTIIIHTTMGKSIEMIIPKDMPNFFDEPYIYLGYMSLTNTVGFMKFRNTLHSVDTFAIGILVDSSLNYHVVGFYVGLAGPYYIYLKLGGNPMKVTRDKFSEYIGMVLKGGD